MTNPLPLPLATEPHPAPLSAMLQALADDASRERIAVADLLEALGDRALAALLFVFAALAGCIAIGYPVAYFVARKAARSRGILLVLLVLPFWISYLMRMLAWTNLLQQDGYVNQVLDWVGLMNEPRNWLDGDWPTVVLGLGSLVATVGYLLAAT